MAAVNTEEFKSNLTTYNAMFGGAGILSGDAQDNEAVSVTLLVPEDSVSLLIGAGGANVNQIKAATGAEMSFCKKAESLNGMRKCFVSGTIATVTKTAFLVSAFSGKTELGFVVKVAAAGAVIGRGGSQLKSVREGSGCNTNFEKDPVASFAGRVLTMRYPHEGEGASQAITKAIYMAIRVPGFASPTQNDCRKGMMGGYQAPMDAMGGMPGGMGMPMGMDPMTGDVGGFGYGAAPAQDLGGAKRYNPYGGRPARGDNVCAIHGKSRGAMNLQPHPNNPRIMVCMEGDMCKGTTDNSASICFTHGKKRGQQNLQPHPTQPGMFVCMETDQCK